MTRSSNNRPPLVTLITIALIGVLVGTLLTSYILGRRYVRLARSHEVVVRHDVSGSGSWYKLDMVLDIVAQKYVDEVDPKEVTDAALSAALLSLDPHSIYMPPVELDEAESQLAGDFEGIGIQFNVPNDTATVLEVISGGPSEKAGLLPGDRILKVDERAIAGKRFPQDSMVRLMKGPSGTRVTLTIDRQGTVFPVEIKRGKIPLHSVDASFMINERTGYIRLSKFSMSTYRDFVEAFGPLLESGMQKLIIDLRDNVGGYMDQAIYLAQELLPAGEMIVYTEGRKFPREEIHSEGKGRLQDVELVVLINEFSASASEILAGAVQDNDRGLIVGRRSFGKGLVQEPVYFTDGSGIRLTVARYYTPSGRCIQKPFTDDYEYEAYDRYNLGGEAYSGEGLTVDSTQVYKTRLGRTVYGGGAIIPDIIVPVDTTRATQFYIACNRKSTQMRYAAWVFDKHPKALAAIDSYPAMDQFLESLDLPSAFPAFARNRDGIELKEGEWAETAPYLLPQLRALIARYSKLGENAFYKYYLEIDDVLKKAIDAPPIAQ
ncbi:MAG: PDZ domain-containing protein [Bacteroidales bacterium]|nr:PDZ domain-containing protein [Bacteroidales bacterium]